MFCPFGCGYLGKTGTLGERSLAAQCHQPPIDTQMMPTAVETSKSGSEATYNSRSFYRQQIMVTGKLARFSTLSLERTDAVQALSEGEGPTGCKTEASGSVVLYRVGLTLHDG